VQSLNVGHAAAAIGLAAAVVATVGISTRASGQQTADSSQAAWKAVEEAFGRKGALQPGGLFRMAFPRSDLKVTVQKVPVKASFALGSYAVFMPMGAEAMVMGDCVLRDEEVQGVMARMLEKGLNVTALHNHLNEMTPHVMYMHFSGRGEPGALARVLREALGPVYKAPANAGGAGSSGGPSIDAKQVESALGYPGRVNPDGILQISVPRAEKITEGGMEIPPGMGLATALNFQPTGGGKAAITGDFTLLGSEVTQVARALRDNGIQVTALHSHGLGDEPRLFYMHFWANDDAVKLAGGLKAALDLTNSKKAEGAK
jgi:hypothetical protein